MLDKELIQSTSSWPFVEIRKLLKDRKELIKAKNKIIFQTGYGPSGLPHIGTFGEVARTTMVVNALNQLTDIPKEIITFSDDMDGLRKIPDNVPNKDLLESVKRNPSEAIKICNKFRELNSKGVSASENEAIEYVSKRNKLTPVNAEIFSIYVIGLHCPDVV